MIDIHQRLRRRLMAAIAAGTLAAAGCGATDPGTTPAPSTDTTAANDAGAGQDTGNNDTGQPADTGTTADTSTAADTGAPEDTSTAADTGTAGDTATATDTATDTATSDTNNATDTQDAAGDTSTDTAWAQGDSINAADSGAAPICQGDKEPTKTCYTATQLLSAASPNYPFGAPLPPDQTLYLMPPDGCPPPSAVKDGCCNSAQGPALLEGDKCCYYHCTGACCGRPLYVAGEPITSAPIARGDWGAAADHERLADATHLDASTKAELAAAWLGDAAAEHTSVASFARFSLDLLAFGAPPELVAGAHMAAADEVEHARICYGLANRYMDGPLGPGPLALAGVSCSATLADAVDSAVREGCVGETIAAMVAQASSATAQDTELKRLLSGLAEDELRHAELAWRFVAWAVATGGETVAAAAHAAFDDAINGALQAPDDPDSIDTAAWQAHGRLTQRGWLAAARAAVHQVIAPCARELLEVDVSVCAPVAVSS